MIRFSLERPAPVRLTVHDAAGRRVALLAEETLGAGSHSRIWEGRNGAGRLASAGIYFVRLVGGSEAMVRRVVFRR